jgi:hypothetical protein
MAWIGCCITAYLAADVCYGRNAYLAIDVCSGINAYLAAAVCTGSLSPT